MPRRFNSARQKCRQLISAWSPCHSVRPSNAGTLNAPELESRRIVTGGDCHPRRFHRRREGVEHTEHNHLVRATIQRGMYASRDLIAAVVNARMGKNEQAARAQRVRQIPLPSAFEVLYRAALAQLGMFARVKLMYFLLQCIAV